MCLVPFQLCLLPKVQQQQQQKNDHKHILILTNFPVMYFKLPATKRCNIVACRTQIVLPGKPKYQRIPKLPPFIKPQKPQWQNKAGQEAEWRRRLIFVKNVHNYCSKRQRERKKRQIRDKFLSLSSFAPLLCLSP